MSLPITWGPAKTGYNEVLSNHRRIEERNKASKPNLGNASLVDEFAEGEWAVPYGVDGIQKSVGIESIAWPIVTGKERSDVNSTKMYTIIEGSGYYLRTNAFYVGASYGGVTLASYTVGLPLTVKSGLLAPALTSGPDPILAVVIDVPTTYQLESEQAVGKAGWLTMVVEVGPRGLAA